jgi:hypothetical protein
MKARLGSVIILYAMRHALWFLFLSNCRSVVRWGIGAQVFVVYKTTCSFVRSACKWQRCSPIAVLPSCGTCVYNEHEFPAIYNSHLAA